MTENALLLLNLGSPDSTRVEDVRRYLDQFLSTTSRSTSMPWWKACVRTCSSPTTICC